MNKHIHIVESIILLSILLLQFSITTIKAQDRTVPGRIVVEFKPGVVSLPSGLLKSTINRSVILSQNVFSVCQAVGATEVEKIFPAAVEGQTEIVSPITGKLVQITDLSRYFFI
ncbi:MAG: hypothetical protein QME52_01730 [Bacteroidota bacterium]|nr:hypothetical protein [Bacteroidota bacterium]